MKKTTILILSALTLPAYAQSLSDILGKYQDSLESSKAVVEKGDGAVVGAVTTKSVSDKKCEVHENSSLPLKEVTGLILEKNAELKINFDSRSGTVTIAAPDMIDNCSSMINWRLKTLDVDGKKKYAVEAKFNDAGDCSEQGCRYKVAMVEKGTFQKYEEMIFKPTLKGFRECLEKTGVIANGKVDKDAIYHGSLKEKFTGIDSSGDLLFVSNGRPTSGLPKAKHGDFEYVDQCDYYERIHPKIKALLSSADEERQHLNAEASQLEKCTVDEYGKVAGFVEKYSGYEAQLGKIRDKLILEAMARSAKMIAEGKEIQPKDLEVISDFEKYIVYPRVAQAQALYRELTNAEPSKKKEIEAELNKLRAELKSLTEKPYMNSAHINKLISLGNFEEAEKLGGVVLTLNSNARIGTKYNNVVQNIEVIRNTIAKGKTSLNRQIASAREDWEVKTGAVTGQSRFWQGRANGMKSNIEARTRNFSEEIQSEYARIQQGGYCHAYFRNTQKCVQDSVERIQELQSYLQHYNKVDAERYAEYMQQAERYGKMEAEGRRYVAAQNGEEMPVENSQLINTLVPSARGGNSYNFEYQGNLPNGQQQQPMVNGQFPQIQNGFQYQGGVQGQWGPQYSQFAQGNQMFMQQPWTANGGGQSYPFSYQGSMQQQFPQQQGYWQNPIQAMPYQYRPF